MQAHTDINKLSNVNHAVLGIHSTIMEADCSDESWTDEQEYAIIADAELGFKINPFPLNQGDILDAGGRIDPDFEERVDCNNHVMEDHEAHNTFVVCTRLSFQ